MTTESTVSEETEDKLESQTKSLEEQIEVFEPVAKAVDWNLKHPDGSEKTFVQHEMGFLTKIKFFRLLAGSLRLASQNNEADIIEELLQARGYSSANTESFLTMLLRLVELVPDFVEETYILALKVKPEDEQWFKEALENLDDETGMKILETFVAQNGKAVQNFFEKHLRKVVKRLTHEIDIDLSAVMGPESEPTT